MDDKTVRIGKYLVTVVKDLCIGAGSCIAFAPGVFKFNDNTKAEIIEGANDTPENILLAAQSCPTKAIVIKDAETGEQVWPK